jgi:hypothetical protein
LIIPDTPCGLTKISWLPKQFLCDHQLNIFNTTGVQSSYLESHPVFGPEFDSLVHVSSPISAWPQTDWNWLPFNGTKYHANLVNWYLDSLNQDIGCPRLDLTKTIEGGAYVNPKLAVKLLWGGRIYRRKSVWCPLHLLCIWFPSLNF